MGQKWTQRNQAYHIIMHHSPFSTKHLEQESPRGTKQSQEESNNYKYATKGAETLSQVRHEGRRNLATSTPRRAQKPCHKYATKGAETLPQVRHEGRRNLATSTPRRAQKPCHKYTISIAQKEKNRGKKNRGRLLS